MPWECTTVTNKRKSLVEAYTDGVPMTSLCKQYKISRKTGYKWVNRWNKGESEMELSDRSRARINLERRFSEQQIAMTINLKCKYRTWGPKKIIARLGQDYPEIKWPSPTRLYEIFKEYDLVTPRKLRKKFATTSPLTDVLRSNDVWMADFKGWVLTGDHEKYEPLTITDGYSRFLIRCSHLSKKNIDNVWGIYKEAFEQYGLPHRMRTDNGPPFGSRGVGRLTKLSVNLIKAGVRPEWINPGHPEENGRHERFHLTLKEATASPPASTLEEQLERSKVFEEEYNYERPHEALKMMTPASQYRPSTRRWDGILRPMEYPSDTPYVRKVGQSGCIWFGQKEYFLGAALTGEHVALKSNEDNELEVYFGPINLGRLNKSGVEKQKRRNKKRFKRV